MSGETGLKMLVLELVHSTLEGHEHELVVKIAGLMRVCKSQSQWNIVEGYFKECLAEKANTVWAMFLLSHEAMAIQAAFEPDPEVKPRVEEKKVLEPAKTRENDLTLAINSIFRD